MKSIIVTLLVFTITCLSFGQGMKQPHLSIEGSKETPSTIRNFQPAIHLPEKMQSKKRLQQLPEIRYMPIANVNSKTTQSALKVVARSESGLPLFITGNLPDIDLSKSMEVRVYNYLGAIQEQLRIQDIQNEFRITRQTKDGAGRTHTRLLQYYEGIEVYGGEVIVHSDQEGKPNVFNGRYFPSPQLESLDPQLTKNVAQQIALADLSERTYIKELTEYEQQFTSKPSEKLLIFHKDLHPNQERLAWYFVLIPNTLDRWEYIIDAQNGAILLQWNSSCSFSGDLGSDHCHEQAESEHEKVDAISSPLPLDGSVTARGRDLFGITRTFNAYEENGVYIMLDVAQPMFDPELTQRNDGNPIGAIFTLDAKNTEPGQGFNVSIASSNDKDNWNDPRAVSAHYNSTVAYRYYLDRFNRNSINGQGGNVVSFFNVTRDGQSMGNAYWNGESMFYGSGDNQFQEPLQKALDVAGHEITHGVIQATAGLIYFDQSGALNESFADVFGTLIEDETYQLGEDVVNTNIFRSGAMRDLSNPNNGGNRFGDTGWQPAHMNEYVNLSSDQDNGGVHINSGIPNFVFFKIATSIGVENAEKIYHEALSEYLTRSSQFIDARLAVIQAGTNFHGANSTEVDAIKRAFDEVGILGAEGSEIEVDLPENEGQDFIVLTDEDFSPIYLFDGENVPVISQTEIASRPSVTDDGSAMVFVANDGTLRTLIFNESTGAYEEFYIESDPQTIWRNVVVSKDGSKIAATTNELDNEIFVFDFDSGSGQSFQLYIPTTSQDELGVSGVQYSDFMEWDYQGEFLMYDAYNILGNGNAGFEIDYWDIGFIQVWDKERENFANGDVFKLITTLPENVSIGNATFSKNSPYIIAFDWFYDDGFTQEYQIMGANIERGELNVISKNSDLGYPNFSPDDQFLIYDSPDNSGAESLDIITLAENKISANGSSSTLINGGKWGVWFVQGGRDLTTTDTQEILDEEFQITVQPNPFQNNLQVNWTSISTADWTIEIFDVLGKRVQSLKMKAVVGENQQNINTENLIAGSYFLRLSNDGQVRILNVVKVF